MKSLRGIVAALIALGASPATMRQGGGRMLTFKWTHNKTLGVAFGVLFAVMALPVHGESIKKVDLISQSEISGGLESFLNRVAPLSTDRYILFGFAWERDASQRPVAKMNRIFDLKTRRFVPLRIPVEKYPETYKSIFGPRPDDGDIVHYNNGIVSIILGQFNNYKLVGKYLIQYNQRTDSFSEPLKLGDLSPSRYIHPLGFDPSEKHYYYALVDRDQKQQGPLRYEISRVNLETLEFDWRTTLDLPRRNFQLDIRTVLFTPDNKKLILIEHNENVYDKKYGRANPPQRVYVIDVPTKRMDTYPIPLSAYGYAVSYDSKYIYLGSFEEGTIIRINLETKRIDKNIQAAKTIRQFQLSPSGKYFLTVLNYDLSNRKVVDVRSGESLNLITSIPVTEVFPGCKGNPAFIANVVGRYLFTQSCDKENPGYIMYELPDNYTPPAAGTKANDVLKFTETMNIARDYATRSGLNFSGDSMGEFKSIAFAPDGNLYLGGIKGHNARNDDDIGHSFPTVAKITRDGKQIWESNIPRKNFGDFTGGTLAPTDDGGVVTYWLSYVMPGWTPSARLVKFNKDGKLLWDRIFPGGGRPNTPAADELKLQSDGSVLMKGQIRVKPEDVRPWTCVVDKNGQVISEKIGN